MKKRKPTPVGCAGGVHSPRERQRRRETDAAEYARRQFLRRRRLRPGSEVVIALSAFAEAIREQQANVIVKTTGPLPKYGAALLSLDADKLALLTLSEVLGGLEAARQEDIGVGLQETEPTVAKAVASLTRACRAERRYDQLRGRARNVEELLKLRDTAPHNARRLAASKAAEVDSKAEPGPGSTWFSLAFFLILLGSEHLGAIELAHGWRPKHTKTKKGVKRSPLTPLVLRYTTTADEWLKALAPPALLPMVHPPVAWTASLDDGGYLTNHETRSTPLVKIGDNKQIRSILADATIPEVLAAVNALQATPWRINRRLLHWLRQAKKEKAIETGLQVGQLQEVPKQPKQGGSKEARRKRSSWWKAYRNNLAFLARRRMLQEQLRIARLFADEPRFFFPYQLDARGRVYAMPHTLNPQGNDLARALLEFADGKPLGRDGAKWLAIHLANLYGLDKKSFPTRLRWVSENERKILQAAADPLGDGLAFWTKGGVREGDKPWRFLAACFEWESFREHGPAFSSHLPVTIDGTCNGMQHLSAMGLDAKGARATNLIRTDIPADLYQVVADCAASRVEADALKGDERAKAWCGKIDRTLAKLPTMTTPYGVTTQGIRRQIRTKARMVLPPTANRRECVEYLAATLELAIGEVVTAAPTIKKWLENVTRTLAREDYGVCWQTPSGFWVLLEHYNAKRARRRIQVQNRSIYLLERDSSLGIDTKAQCRCIVSYLVHSYDAAHLILVVNRLVSYGLKYFGTVHDSFSVHACDVERLGSALRETFVTIYLEPVLANFLAAQRRAHPELQFDENLPVESGSAALAMHLVRDSPYFFC